MSDASLTDREIATREILDVIARSRSDTQPVFDVLMHHAQVLSKSHFAAIQLIDDKREFFRVAAWTARDPDSIRTMLNNPIALSDEGSSFNQAIGTGKAVHIIDPSKTDRYKSGAPPIRSTGVDRLKMGTLLNVPLMTADGPLGVLSVFRTEIAAYSDAEIALLETFANQAVIALENVRQFREVQTRLDREQASREILHIIGTSRDDDAPVFKAILDRAMHLCDCEASGMQFVNEARTHLVYAHSGGADDGTFEPGDLFPLDSQLGMAIAVRDARVVHSPDLKDSDLYRDGDALRRKLVDDEGVLSQLAVPLITSDGVVGTITLSRKEQRAFTDDEIALVESFAAQAVIAIENVRQFKALQSRMEREAASAQVLETISTSRDDDAPVFDTILENTMKLCETHLASVWLVDEEKDVVTRVAQRGMNDATLSELERHRGYQRAMSDTESSMVKPILTGKVVEISDMRETERFKDPESIRQRSFDIVGVRSLISVPLMRDGKGIGTILAFRNEPRPFTPDQIDLMRTFAAQAVIAIENAAQFNALETLNAELGDRVEEQVGEIERMGKLKRFLPAAVADTVVSSGSENMLKSHRALIGVLFCDIRGFTAFCETAEPEETIEVLQTYHEEMGKLITTHGAGVDHHRMGDGIMVLFNDPVPCDDPAGAAVSLAIAMQARMATLCKQWK